MDIYHIGLTIGRLDINPIIVAEMLPQYHQTEKDVNYISLGWNHFPVKAIGQPSTQSERCGSKRKHACKHYQVNEPIGYMQTLSSNWATYLYESHYIWKESSIFIFHVFS